MWKKNTEEIKKIIRRSIKDIEEVVEKLRADGEDMWLGTTKDLMIAILASGEVDCIIQERNINKKTCGNCKYSIIDPDQEGLVVCGDCVGPLGKICYYIKTDEPACNKWKLKEEEEED